ncbi:hypothetical protein HNR32_000607 [Pectinatus brassicae]|uniref:Uncharacterized protein n=1 Tax=Pectinatus brassicae TaxID=862415 RepID=A0A840UMK3_9FIRM|nr:hypothetical protein [Pectinatus brassicae]
MKEKNTKNNPVAEADEMHKELPHKKQKKLKKPKRVYN